MSDSDSDYGDLDFVSKSTSSLRPVDLDLNKEAPEQAQRSLDTSLLDSSNISLQHQNIKENKENKFKKKGKRETVEETPSPLKTRCSLTPPSSPKLNPVVGGKKERAVRGAARTKKTTQALKAIEISKARKNPAPAIPSPAAPTKAKKSKGRRGRWREIRESAVLVTPGERIEIKEDNEAVHDDDAFEIKIQWKTDVLRVKVKDSDRIGFVMDAVADRLSLNPGDIGFIKHNADIDVSGEVSEESWILRDVTVADLKLSIVSIIIARTRDLSRPDANDLIELKVQTRDKRAAVHIKVAKTDKMEVLMNKFCELKGLQRSAARFYFDGEDLEACDTSETLDLEGGECIDVHLTNPD